MKDYDPEGKEGYLTGLKKYRDKGIPILIDGKECTEEEWNKLLFVQEDGSFYMADFIGAENGELKEIRFDRVHNK